VGGHERLTVPGAATREAISALATVSEAPPWEREQRPRPTWGLVEGDAIAPGRTVLRSLGGGRRYEVFLVWDDHRLAVLVAKLLRPELASDPAALRELADEAEALARLAHPVLVRGYDVVADGRFPHLLIEHLEGPTLAELIRDVRGALPLEQLLPLGLHVASALHYLAAEGIVHLDVKPDNVVMGAPPRLIDLSVSRSVDAAARLRRPVGTDGYMAPEQCDPSRGVVGPPADVFGLAATLHHAVSGVRPFARDGEARFPQLERDAPALPRRVPGALAALLSGGLARDPAARPTAAEFAAGLEPLVAGLPRRLVLGRRGWRRR
jgi:eukaryotic-like serine/threonine-protein kinase